MADLTELLTSVDLYGATVGEDGKLHVISNAAGYEIQLNFKEQYEKQFANGETLTYKLPAGIVSENANGTFSIKIKDHTGAVKEIQGNSYTVASDGTVSINFNQDDPNYASLTASANVKFGLRLSVKFDNKVIKDKIDFGNSVTKDVIVDDVHKLEIRKSGTLQDDGKMHYSVEITSTGNNTDVFVQDAIKGDILTFDDNVTLSSNKSRSDLDAVNSNKESNGFSLTIPSMEHGEKITLNYTASVNWEKVGAGTVSKDDKTNTVKVKSKENPNEVKKDYEYTNEIRYDAISKGHSEPIGNTSKTIDWTLDVNSKKYLTFANQTIKDSIAAESQNIMHYTGDGITILVKKDDGTEEIRNVKWSGLKITKDADENVVAWEYKIPESDGKWAYHITYSTIVDMEGKTSNVTVKNNASAGEYGTGDSVDVKPGEENGTGIDKTVVSYSAESIRWRVTITVPGIGMTPCEVKDKLPSKWINKMLIDELDGTVEIKGLDSDETYETSEITENNIKYVIWKFYKDKDKKNPGLNASANGKRRKIEIEFSTKVNKEWYNNAKDPDHFTHINEVYLNNDLSSQASVAIEKPKIDKKRGYEDTEITIDGKKYPVFSFYIILNNLNNASFPINIYDYFDTDIFQLHSYDAIRGGNQYSQDAKDGGDISAKDTENGITFTINSLPKDKNGNYYPYYCIPYRIRVKDIDALSNLALEAIKNNGTAVLTNKAKYGDLEKTINFEYKYTPLTKALVAEASYGNKYVASYELNANPSGAIINEGNDLTITDTLSGSIRFIEESLKVYVDGTETAVPYDINDKTLTIVVPDGKTIKVTYKAQVIGADKEVVSYKNSASMTGTKTIELPEKTVTIDTNGMGEGDTSAIYLYKHVYGNHRQPLSGAVFQLYQYDKSNELTPVKGNDGNVFVTTGADGKAEVYGHMEKDGWALQKDVKYSLIETKAPEGYALDSTPIDFVIQDVPSSEIGYTTGSSISVSNAKENFRIIKVDKDTQQVLSGAVFDLTGKIDGKNQTVQVTTGSDGVAAFSKLEPGEYELREVTAPSGYKIDSKIYKITVTEDLEIVCTEGGLTINKNDEGVYAAQIGNERDTTSITVNKVWDDSENQDGKRPEGVEVELYANGNPTGKKVTLNEVNKWTYTWEDLDEKANGKKITYSVKETGETNGEVTFDGAKYTVAYADDQNGHITVTNTHIPSTVDIEGSKTWDDQGNEGARPEKITIHLKADGVEKDSKEVTAEAGWKWKFENLPEYSAGTKITYTVVEDTVENYVTSKGEGAYDIKNTYNPGKTSITVNKVWDDSENQDGKRPEGVEVELYANGNPTGKKVTLDEANQWTHTWKDLDEKANGKKIIYSVKETGETNGEVTFDGAKYTVAYADDQKGHITVTNTHIPSTVDIEGSKTWDDQGNEGARPEKITIHLKADGEEKDSKEVTAEAGWKWKFANLPEYSAGTKITYTVVEDTVENYVTSKGEGAYDIKNTYNPGKTSITVNKVWDDSENQDGKRPEGVEVELYANGNPTGKKVTLDEANQWTHTWKDLDEKANGKKIIYSVKETGETNGEVTFDGAKYTVAYADDENGHITVTNTHIPSTVDIEGSKTWDDQGNEGARPEKITIHLKADGEEKDSKEVTAEAGWKWKFANLPEYSAGTKITYTVVEDTVENYVTSKGEGAYDIKNTYNPGKTSITVNKVWDDSENQDGKRPEGVEVELYANGNPTGKKVTLDKANQWDPYLGRP